MQPSFKDYFSRASQVYRDTRPGYPDDLFAWLASVSPSTDAVWDCATGSGQAAVSLARYFSRVLATDASAEQLGHAQPHDRIAYSVARAEHSSLPDSSVDLVTVATAAHWFDLDAFYAEVRRVLRPGGVLALWSYGMTRITPDIDAVLHRYVREVLRGYWPPETQHVMNGYSTLPFPFPHIDTPAFSSRLLWSLERMVGFLTSWSSTQNYRTATGADPVDHILPDLRAAWGTGEREVTWNLAVLAGRRPAE